MKGNKDKRNALFLKYVEVLAKNPAISPDIERGERKILHFAREMLPPPTKEEERKRFSPPREKKFFLSLAKEKP